jgi:hypothetical protein
VFSVTQEPILFFFTICVNFSHRGIKRVHWSLTVGTRVHFTLPVSWGPADIHGVAVVTSGNRLLLYEKIILWFRLFCSMTDGHRKISFQCKRHTHRARAPAWHWRSGVRFSTCKAGAFTESSRASSPSATRVLGRHLDTDHEWAPRLSLAATPQFHAKNPCIWKRVIKQSKITNANNCTIRAAVAQFSEATDYREQARCPILGRDTVLPLATKFTRTAGGLPPIQQLPAASQMQ